MHHDLELELDVRGGEHHDLVLTLAATGDAQPEEPDRAWAATEEGWRRHRAAASGLIADRDVHHAHSVLAGMTSSSGGMVAAATMGLPERAEKGRNYDYRYAWIRDQSIVGIAAAHGANPDLLDHAVRFVAERLHVDGPQLAPAYTVGGAPVPDERRLHLPGYPGGADVVGNWVNRQFQLDAFGEALELFATADAQDRLEPDGWAAACIAAEADRRPLGGARRRDLGAGTGPLDREPAVLRRRSAGGGPPTPGGAGRGRLGGARGPAGRRRVPARAAPERTLAAEPDRRTCRRRPVAAGAARRARPATPAPPRRCVRSSTS